MHFTMFLAAMLVQQPYDAPVDAKASCKVLSTADASVYLFVRIQEVGTDKIVFQSTLRGGQEKGVYVAGKTIKVERKSAGDIDYHSAMVVNCENGNTIRL